MAKRDERKQLYYREAEACYRQGLISQKQYDMIMQALGDDIFTVEYKSLPSRSGHQVQFIIKTSGKVD